MTLRLEDLPPAMRRQVEAKTGRAPKTPRAQARGSSCGSCHACDWRGIESAWEKHSDAEGHHRWDMDLAS